MRQIELHSKKYPGLFALVDDDDYELVSRYRWRPSKKKHDRTFYAMATVCVDGKETTIRMHRLILGIPGKVDHENRNGLDNRRCNLRPVTSEQNAANKAKNRGTCTSLFKGVYWVARAGKWRAVIQPNGKFKSLGWFFDEVEAAKAYDRAAIDAFGEFARTNFPVETYEYDQLPLAA